MSASTSTPELFLGVTWTVSAGRDGAFLDYLLKFFLVHLQRCVDRLFILGLGLCLRLVVGPVGRSYYGCSMFFRYLRYCFAEFDAGLQVLKHHADGHKLESSWIDEL